MLEDCRFNFAQEDYLLQIDVINGRRVNRSRSEQVN